MVTECCTVPPVPESATLTGVVDALLVTCRLPVAAPLVCGANVTVMDAVAPGLRVRGVVRPAAVKPVPLTATLLMLTLTVEGLLTVTVWFAADPIRTVPNPTEVGLTVMEPVGVGVGEGEGVGVGVGDGAGVGVGVGEGEVVAPMNS